MKNSSHKNDFKIYKFKYRKKRIVLGYCQSKNCNWFCDKVDGTIFVYIGNMLSDRMKQKALHTAIKRF